MENPLNDIKLVDNNKLYLEEDISIEEVYVTIVPPSNKDYVTFNELNNNITLIDKDSHSFEEYRAEVVFEYNNIGNDNLVANGTMKLRGQTSRFSKQKSYKIKLYDNASSWNGVRTINLNKHFYDETRIRNKLSYDYFKEIDNFISMRTQFVKLYIRDLSSNQADSNYNYYGLYTAIEQPNKRFLKEHKFDENGHLYKAEYFEFFQYDNIKLKDDITYDKDKFENILEIIGNDNHNKLIDMINAVNDYSQNINDVVDKFFDRDNLFTWLGINILLNNHDSNSRNFLLYSPLNSNKWFFSSLGL